MAIPNSHQCNNQFAFLYGKPYNIFVVLYLIDSYLLSHSQDNERKSFKNKKVFKLFLKEM